MQPKRGEVWQVDFGLAGKVRPAVVISVDLTDLDRALFCVAPHTTTLRGSRFEIIVPMRFLDPGAFLLQGVTNFTIRRFERRLGILDESQMRLVENGLRLLFAL